MRRHEGDFCPLVNDFGAEVDSQRDGELGDNVSDGILDAFALMLTEVVAGEYKAWKDVNGFREKINVSVYPNTLLASTAHFCM